MLLFMDPLEQERQLYFHLQLLIGLTLLQESQSGLTVCAQPRRILARQLRERVRENKKLMSSNKSPV